MSSAKPAMPSGSQVVRLPVLLQLARTLWQRLRPRSQARTKRLATMSDHLLADVGLNRPSYEQPTWERYIHRQ